MKTLITVILTCTFAISLLSQTSPLDPVCTFNYQAVARDADDNIMADQAMTVRFTILDGPGANELYLEEHSTTTSSLGLFNLEVGNGTVVGGTLLFDAIPWIIRKHFLRVELDLDGSGNFIIAGEAPILAVPIAIQAKVASISMSTMDTIKRIDTIRVDTLNVKKIFAKAICVDSIIGKVVIDSIITELICANGDIEIKDGDLVMKDADGEIIFKVDSTGRSWHAGFETFAGGLEVLDLFGEIILEVDPIFGITIADDVLIEGGGLTMEDKDGNVIFSIDTLGNSYHAGFETFAGGMEVLGIDGKPVFTIDPLLEFIFGTSTSTQGDVAIENGHFEMFDRDGNVVFAVDTLGNSFHAGFEIFAGGLVVMDDSNNPIITIDSEDAKLRVTSSVTEGDVTIDNGHFEMFDRDGNVVFAVDTLGNSFHAGFEIFAGGLVVMDDSNNPIITIDSEDAKLRVTSSVTEGDVTIDNGHFEMFDRDGNIVFSVDTFGNSFHKGLEVFEGGLIIADPLTKQPIVVVDVTPNILNENAMTINGNIRVNGLLQAEAKQFAIDHPLNPEEMILRHYSIESDQMGTVYNGTVSFNEKGEAWVALPDWFEALNTDFSYQLTCIGGFANVYIAEEVNDNRFKIAGGNKELKVSWQVNAVRHDPNSEKNRLPIEEYRNPKLKQK